MNIPIILPIIITVSALLMTYMIKTSRKSGEKYMGIRNFKEKMKMKEKEIIIISDPSDEVESILQTIEI